MLLPLLVANLLSGPVFAGPERPLPFVKPFLLKDHRFVVCCHRGDHTEAPENTLDAYSEAIKDDADFVEMDLRMSKDGVIVLMHDSTVDRTTTGTGKVADMTLAELEDLKFKNPRRAAEKVPTFDEVLDLCKDKIHIYMDIKAVTPQQVLPYLKRHGMEKQVIAYVYGPLQRAQWRDGAPDIPLISDLDGMKSPDQIGTDWKASPFAITDGNAMKYTGEFVQKWHDLGVAVVPDIQNPLESPSQWQPRIDMGVDGFQTDHPKQLIAYLKEKGIR